MGIKDAENLSIAGSSVESHPKQFSLRTPVRILAMSRVIEFGSALKETIAIFRNAKKKTSLKIFKLRRSISNRDLLL